MKHLLLIPCLLTSMALFAQTHKKPDQKASAMHPAHIDSARAHPDTLYTLNPKELNLIYTLLNAGFHGVQTSDDYSVSQRKWYAGQLNRVDSLFRPQILKWQGKKGAGK